MATRPSGLKKRVLARFARLIATEQRLDQGRQFLGANAIVLIGNRSRHAALPLELDGDGFDLFRDPRTVNAAENHNVLAAGSNGTDFVLVIRERDCLENGSVEVGYGHNCIVHTWSGLSQSWVL
jgi:hypothetical protein